MMKTVARCQVYETRPEVCKVYPTVGHYMPPVCTYTFPGGGLEERQGECTCDEGACCVVPREGGEPGGAPMPEVAGGQPCKHLSWEEQEVPMTKEAAEELANLSNDTEMATNHLLQILGQDVEA